MLPAKSGSVKVMVVLMMRPSCLCLSDALQMFKQKCMFTPGTEYCGVLTCVTASHAQADKNSEVLVTWIARVLK